MAISEQLCRRCGHDFCSECVVYPFGVAKGAMCITCALEAGGVSRQKTGRPKLTSKQIRKRVSNVDHDVAQEPAPEPEVTEAPPDDLDHEWLNGEVDAETLGGWSRTF